MNVVSVFDGMSCGMQALKNIGITPSIYISSEIDKHAIAVSSDNHKNIIQFGDITKIRFRDGWIMNDKKALYIGKVNLLIGGSPCQGFSYAGKGLNFKDPSSRLFFEFVRLKKEMDPDNFLLENVKMKKEWERIISNFIGCEPLFVNSMLVSAQDRKRLYWSDLPLTVPQDMGVSWSDISEDGWYAGAMRGRRVNEYGKRDDYNKDLKIIQYVESRKDNKTNCISTVGKDNICSIKKVGRVPVDLMTWRYMTRGELEALQTLPIGYTKAVSYSKAAEMIGNGWTVKVIEHFFKQLYLTENPHKK